MSTDRLQEIKERAEKATPGPWDSVCSSGAIRHVVRNVDHDSYCSNESNHETFGKYDGEFIAHSREDIPWLIREIEAAKERIKMFENQLLQAKIFTAIQPPKEPK